MFMKKIFCSIGLIGVLVSCQSNGKLKQENLQAVFKSAKGQNLSGTLVLAPQGEGVSLQGKIFGLNPNSAHAIHIHETGSCKMPDFKSAGGHFNPMDTPHGLPNEKDKHSGDMGNLKSDANGVAKVDAVFDHFSLTKGKTAVVGRAIIVHAKKDLGVQPTGAAGARIGCAIIKRVSGE